MRNLLFPSALSHAHTFTPDWYVNAKVTPLPVFHLRAASFADRAQYLAELEAAAGLDIYQFQKDAAFQEGLMLLLPDREDQPSNADDRAHLFEILANTRAREAVSEAERALLNKAWDLVQHSAVYTTLKELTQREALRNQMLPAFALLHFCTGIDNLKTVDGDPIVFEADERGRMSEATLLQLDQADFWVAGTFAHNLQWGRSAEKNSSSRLKSGAKRNRSAAASKGRGSSTDARPRAAKKATPGL